MSRESTNDSISVFWSPHLTQMIALSKKQEGVYLGTLGILGDFHLQQIRIDRKNPPTTRQMISPTLWPSFQLAQPNFPSNPTSMALIVAISYEYTILNTSHQTNLPQSKD